MTTIKHLLPDGGTTTRPFAVTPAYDGPFGNVTDILSQHATQELAEAAAKRRAPGESGNWLRIRDLREYGR